MTPPLKLLAHIGYYKTGTTWLQKHVFGRTDRGFAPVSIGRESTPKKAAKQFGAYLYRDERGRQLSSFDIDTERARTFLSQAAPDPDQAYVVSDERLTGYFFANGPDGKSIADRLVSIAPGAKVLITVRRQADMILSCYLQYLKRGGTLTLKTLITERHDDRLPLFSPHFFEYHHAAQYYSKLFGRENVVVLPYELFSTEPEKFLRLIYGHAEVNFDPHANSFRFGQRENTSEKMAAYIALRPFSRLFHRGSLNLYPRSPLGSRGRQAYQLSCKGISRLTSTRRELSVRKGLQETISRYVPQEGFLESNQILQNQCPVDLTAFGYRA
jgi:hypothetical protein